MENVGLCVRLGFGDGSFIGGGSRVMVVVWWCDGSAGVMEGRYPAKKKGSKVSQEH